MKKNSFNVVKVVFSLAIAFAAGYSVYASQQEKTMTDLALANVEALADDEINPLCPNGCVDNGSGCACNGIYVKTWKEYNW